jgi:tyrosine-protein phosphatase YwqE
MLNLFKKKSPTPFLTWLNSDMHSHLIPGIDDGAPDVATGIEMIKGLMELGFKKFITTPHVLWDVYPNTPEIINRGVQLLREAIIEASIDAEVHAAAEYFIDDHFQQHLKNKLPLLTISENKVLVEFSMISPPLDLKEVLFELQMQGYHPVIAHPERYIYLNNKFGFFEDLKSADCLFQINLLSLSGYYGKAVQELADYLIRNDYYDYAGTDLHNPKQIDALQKIATTPAYSRLKDSDKIKNKLL